MNTKWIKKLRWIWIPLIIIFIIIDIYDMGIVKTVLKYSFLYLIVTIGLYLLLKYPMESL